MTTCWSQSTVSSRLIRWTGLAPWEFEFPFSGRLTSTFLASALTSESCVEQWESTGSVDSGKSEARDQKGTAWEVTRNPCLFCVVPVTLAPYLLFPLPLPLTSYPSAAHPSPPNSKPRTRNSNHKIQTPNPKSNSKPRTRNPNHKIQMPNPKFKPKIQSTKPKTQNLNPNPKPQALNSKPQTLNLES